MRIQHNIMAMNAYRNYNNNTSALSKNLEKLSSGYKINRAGDDAAGLAISEKMRAQITGLNAAQKNVKDGISLVKTAEGAMQEIQDMLNRMDYLATQSANGTYDNEVDRANLQKEVDALRTEIDRIADSANFNGINLLDGSRAANTAQVTTVSVNATAAVTAGAVASAGGTVAATVYDANFSTTVGHGGVHEGQDIVRQRDPSFSIDLNGIEISGVTTAAAGSTITITVAGVTVAVTAKVTTAGDLVTASALGTKLNGVTVNIDGVQYTLTNTSGKITFNATTAGTADGHATTINDALQSEVEVGGTGLTAGGNWTHGVQDITTGKDYDAGSLAGISFKLDDKVVADGNKLVIGNQEFRVQVGGSNSSVTISSSGNTHVIEIDEANTAGFEEAARQMALSATEIDSEDDVSTKFKISTVDGNIIHIDQQKQTGSTQDKTYDTAALKGLFTVTTPEVTTNTKASVTLTPGAISIDVADGDVVGFNGKTYTIGEAPEGTKDRDKASYMTAASFNALVQTETLNKLAETAKKEFGDGYTVTVADGKVKIEATAASNADTPSALNTKVQAIKDAVSTVSVSKVAKDKVGKDGLMLQIGDTSDPFNQMSVKIGDMHVDAMGTMKASGVEGGSQTVETNKSIADISIATQEDAAAAVDVIKNAINYVSSVRGDLGAIQNRLEHTQNNLSVMAENIQDAESTIRDTDVAEEMMSYVKNNILVQSAQAMLAQANQVPQGVLQLLG